MKKGVLVCAAIAVVVVVFFLTRRDVASTVGAKGVDASARRVEEPVDATSRRVEEGPSLTRRDVASTVEEDEPQAEDEKREAAEEKLVEAFDNLTDTWQEASVKGVSMSDIDKFAKMFRTVPKDRQDECIHRALNLIPDENVMLLAGVLMDKSMDKEIVETVFNDILNRDEDVKNPILQEIYKDKTHPCWADAAWILDITGARDGGTNGGKFENGD